MKKIAVVAILILATLLAVVGCKSVTVSSISVSGAKSIYQLNEQFNYKTGKIIITMSDDTKKDIALDAEGVEISGFDSSTAGDKTITVKYDGAETTYTVNIVGITSLTVPTNSQIKVTYNLGERFSTANGYILANKTNGESEAIFLSDARVSFDDSVMDMPGIDLDVVVSYAGQSAKVKVTVKDTAIKSISVTPPTKTEYWTHEPTLDLTGGQIIVTKADNTVDAPIALSKAKEDKNDIIYNFAVRTENTNPSKATVTVQYRGHSTSFEVDVFSKLESITYNGEPKTEYVEGELFFVDYGAINLNFHDKKQQRIAFDDSNVELVVLNSANEPVAGFETQGLSAGTYSIYFKYDEFETAKRTITVETNAAVTAVLEKLYSFENINIDWEEPNPSVLSGKSAQIKLMWEAYKALNGTNRNKLILYKNRIISLSYANEVLELLERSMQVDVDLTQSKFATPSVLTAEKNRLTAYSTDVTAANGVLTEFTASDFAIVLQGANITSASVSMAIRTQQTIANDFITQITLLQKLYNGFEVLDAQDITSDYKFSTNVLDAAYLELVKIIDAKTNIDKEIYILESWNPEYRAIMLEYVYQKNNSSYLYGKNPSVLVPTSAVYYNPDVLLKSFNTPTTMGMSMYLRNIYSTADNWQGGAYSLFLVNFVELRYLVEDMYANGFSSMIEAYERFPIFPVSYNGTIIEYDLKFLFDDYNSVNKQIYAILTNGNYYVPNGALQDFMKLYNPIYLRFIESLGGSSGSYVAGNADYDRDAVELRNAYLDLVSPNPTSGFNTMNQLEHFAMFSNYMYFVDEKLDKPVPGFMDLYMQNKLSANVLRVYKAYKEVHISYLYYISEGDDASSIRFNNALANFIIVKDSITSEEQKKEIKDNLSLEVEFVSRAQEWANNIISTNIPDNMLLAYSHIVNITNNAIPNNQYDQYAAIFLDLTRFIGEECTESDLEFFRTVSFSTMDGDTLEDGYESIKAKFISDYGFAEDAIALIEAQVAEASKINGLGEDEPVDPKANFFPDTDGKDVELDFFMQYMSVMLEHMLRTADARREDEDAKYDWSTDVEFIGFVDELRENFFDLTVPQMLSFVSKGHYISRSFLFDTLFAGYAVIELPDEEEVDIEETDPDKIVTPTFAYGAVLAVIKNLFIYDAGYTSIDMIAIDLNSYDSAVDILDADEKVDYLGLVTGYELELIEYIRTFIGRIKGQGDAWRVIDLATKAIAQYNYYGEIVSFDAYAKVALDAYDPQYANLEIFEGGGLITSSGTIKTLGALIAEIESISKLIHAMNRADDDDSVAIYDLLARMVYCYLEAGDGASKDNAYVFDEYLGEDTIISSRDFQEDFEDLLEMFEELSSYQQTAFYVLQESIRYGSYFKTFFNYYYAIKLGATTASTANTNMLKTITALSELVSAYPLLLSDMLAYQSTDATTTTYKSVATAFETAYAKLTTDQKTAFGTALGTTYTHNIAIYNALENATSDEFRYYLLDYYRAVESALLVDSCGDYTYFNYYYATIWYSAYASLASNATSKNTIDGLLTFKSYKGIVYVPVTTQNPHGYFKNYVDAIGQAVTNLATFFSRFNFVFVRFIEAEGGLSCYYTFNSSMYDNQDPIGDIAMIIAFYNKLDAPQQKIFEDSFGVMYRVMLRYYNAYSLSDTEFLKWYDGLWK